MKLYIHHLTIKSLLVKTMPCWAAHTLYQLMTFKVMHTPLLPPLGFHYTCQIMHKVLIYYNFFLLSPFPDLRDRSLKCHVSSWLWRRFVGHLLFLSFRHCELHTPCKQRFLLGMAFSICKVIPGRGTPGNTWWGCAAQFSQS